MASHLDEMRGLISLVEEAKNNEQLVLEGLWNKLKAYLGNVEAEHKEIFEKASKILMRNWQSQQSKLKSVNKNNEKHPIDDLGKWLHDEVGYKPKYIQAAFNQIPSLKKEVERMKQDGDDKIEVDSKDVLKAFYLMVVMADLDHEQPHSVQQWMKAEAPKPKAKQEKPSQASSTPAAPAPDSVALKDFVNKETVKKAGVTLDTKALAALRSKSWSDVSHDNTAIQQLAMLGLVALRQSKG